MPRKKKPENAPEGDSPEKGDQILETESKADTGQDAPPPEAEKPPEPVETPEPSKPEPLPKNASQAEPAKPILSGAGDLVAEHLDSIPTPTKPSEKELNETGESEEDIDKAGNEFDPDKYKIDREGKPRRDKRGYFIPINKGRPKAGAKKETQNAAPGLPPNMDDADVYGALFVDTGTSVLAGVFSDPEWMPESPEERTQLVTCVAAYLRTKDEMDLPPGWALAMGLSVYAGKRLSKPTIREKIGLFFIRIKNLLKGKKNGTTETE